ncbi:MAG TPA: decaprenyl-phosphate phosphoribosyltransferase [Candidatus Deferrimicrobium sp.]|nr:decaprenyl-phosphate phosphoribosyltransferase [Candidatus Deferrimicrobium sp.]
MPWLLIKLARPIHWLKNGIILLALIFAGELTDPAKLELALAAIAVYCLLASAVYTFNDLLDRKTDREHPLKKQRPIASGRVSTPLAAAMVLILCAAGLLTSWLINADFFVTAIAFLGLNLLYSLWLKHLVIIDVMTVALSFVVRAYAGAFAIEVPASKWMLINTLLLALFLAFGKRRHELVMLEGKATSHRRILERYSPYLLDQLIAVITPSVLVMYMLYSFSPEVSLKLGTQNLFVTIPFVVYGIFRYLYLIHKEEQGGSPTRILIGDRPILVTVLLWLITSIVVLYVL